MFEFLKKNPKYMVGGIIVNLFFIVLFGVGFHLKSQERAASAVPKTVEVKTIDERLVEKELQQLKLKDNLEEQRQKDIIKQRKAEEKRLADLRKQRLQEQENEKKRVALLEKKEKELKEKQLQQEQRAKELKKKREAEEQADKAKKAEALQQKLLADQKVRDLEEQAEALRQAELKKKNSITAEYMNRIEAKIIQAWIKPPSVTEDKIAELDVQLIPTGDVIDVRVSKSSGDPVYDESVKQAVRRASPLPLPPADADLFEEFRHLILPIKANKKT